MSNMLAHDDIRYTDRSFYMKLLYNSFIDWNGMKSQLGSQNGREMPKETGSMCRAPVNAIGLTLLTQIARTGTEIHPEHETFK